MAVERRGRRWAAILYDRGDRTWLGSFDTRREAQRAHAEAIAGTSRSTGRLTVDEWADRWLDEFPPAENSTRRTYAVAADAVGRAFAGVALGAVTRQQARSWSLDPRAISRPLVRPMDAAQQVVPRAASRRPDPADEVLFAEAQRAA